jgi:hypothetical protein
MSAPFAVCRSVLVFCSVSSQRACILHCPFRIVSHTSYDTSPDRSVLCEDHRVQQRTTPGSGEVSPARITDRSQQTFTKSHEELTKAEWIPPHIETAPAAGSKWHRHSSGFLPQLRWKSQQGRVSYLGELPLSLTSDARNSCLFGSPTLTESPKVAHRADANEKRHQCRRMFPYCHGNRST